MNRLKDVRYTRWIALAVVRAALGLILSIEVYFSLRVSMPEVEFGDVLGPQYMRVTLVGLPKLDHLNS